MRSTRLAVTAMVLLIGVSMSTGSTMAGMQVPCYKDPKVKAIEAEIAAKTKQMPKWGVGKQVASGTCTLRALKLGVVMGLKRDYENMRDLQNAIDCLELEKYFFKKDCECRKKGSSYNSDPEFVDSFLERYRETKTLVKKLQSAASPNIVIKSYQKKVWNLIDCVNQQTYAELDRTFKDLERIDLNQP